MPPDAPALAREVPLDLAAIEAAQDDIAGWVEAQGIAPAVAYKLRLVIEELLANLVMHGRFDGPPPPARVSVGFSAGSLLLTIEDASEPYDPRAAPEPAAPSLDDDKVGGLGLALVRRMAEIRAYDRLPGGWNRCELVLPLA